MLTVSAIRTPPGASARRASCEEAEDRRRGGQCSTTWNATTAPSSPAPPRRQRREGVAFLDVEAARRGRPRPRPGSTRRRCRRFPLPRAAAGTRRARSPTSSTGPGTSLRSVEVEPLALGDLGRAAAEALLEERVDAGGSAGAARRRASEAGRAPRRRGAARLGQRQPGLLDARAARELVDAATPREPLDASARRADPPSSESELKVDWLRQRKRSARIARRLIGSSGAPVRDRGRQDLLRPAESDAAPRPVAGNPAAAAAAGAGAVSAIAARISSARTRFRSGSDAPSRPRRG